MSRTRLISPKFFTNADLYDAEIASALPLRLTFAGLWSVTDRRGVFRWSRNLKPEVLPYDPCDILACLEALERAGFVRSYEVDGRKYGWIPTFTAHQTFHHRERPSADPGPPWDVPPARGADADSALSHESLGPTRGQPETSPTASVTASASGTASGTVEQQAAAARGALRVTLATAANDALDAAFGNSHKRRPLAPATAAAVLEVLDEHRIPPEFAVVAITDAVAKLKEPPRSLAYFAPIILERWTARGAAPASTRPRRSRTMADKIAAIEAGAGKLQEVGHG